MDCDDKVAALVQVKKVQKAQEREERIRDQDVANEFSARNVEDDKLTRILRSRGLSLFEVVCSVLCSHSFSESSHNCHVAFLCTCHPSPSHCFTRCLKCASFKRPS